MAKVHLTDGNDDGTVLGQSPSDKISLYGKDPIVQPAGADQADQGEMTTVGSNTGTAGAGLSLIGDTSTTDQSAAIMNDLRALQEDIVALDKIVTAMRTALVTLGAMKGSA